MDERDERRIALNEVAFRAANEGIEKGLWPEQEHETIRFRCECANPDCAEWLRVEVSVYQQVRENGRRFILVAGHEIPSAEKVVERAAGYVVVEKVGVGGEVADERDPRG